MDLHRLHQTTNLADRSRFVWMWSNGMSARAIAQKTGASVTTICRWIRRWRREGHINTRPRRGRPRKSGRSSALCIHSHLHQLPSCVLSARAIDDHIAHALPLNYSSLIRLQFFQKLYTAGYQLLLAEILVKLKEYPKSSLSPELD